MAASPTRHDLYGLALWIYFSAWCSATGWILSALGSLNRSGYAAALLLFVIGMAFIYGRSELHMPTISLRRFTPFFRGRLVPRIWLLLVLLAFVGGVAYSPTNYDYLTYRFPRILHWCWNQHWQWITTIDVRMNLSGTGFEWLMVPLFVFFKTDRLFFLINFIPFLLLPGLVFSVFRHLGISPRLSWWWMWVLPCGYCYILQAPSAGNDSLATVYLLASLHYLFLARAGSSVKNLALSCLAIALLTGTKATNLPLVLPWLTALFLSRAYVLEKGRSAMICLTLPVAALISFLPVALLNIHFTGSYSGDPHNRVKVQLTDPVAAVLGNSLQMADGNLAPPVLPRPIDWEPLIPADLKGGLLRDFPRLDLHMGEFQMEEGAGVGLGIVLFVSLFIGWGIVARIAKPELIVGRDSRALWVVGAGAVAWSAYMSRMGSEATSRLIAAYYPLLIAGILVAISLDGRIVRRRIFKWFGLTATLSAIPLVIFSPARPLFPVHAVANIMTKSRIPAKLITRYNQVYRVYATRAEAFKELSVLIPPSERVIGFLPAGDDAETSLWRPFGTRSVIEVTPDDSVKEIKARGIHFVVVNQNALTYRYHTTPSLLAAKWSAYLVGEKSIILMLHVGPEPWYVLSL